MKDFAGRTAFITGGAGGIGLAMARAFLDLGMNVMLVDVEQPALDAALHGLANHGGRIAGTLCDVSVTDQLERAAAEAIATFGKVHVVCNNAGVSRAGRVDQIAPGDWEWVIAVNLMATIHGIRLFLPHMREHGDGGHFVNTASIAGLAPGALSGPYAATKFGVIGVSEVLAQELAGTNIGVSVLCPSMVRTRMVDNGRNRPGRFGGGFALETNGEIAERNARYLAANAAGHDPDTVPPKVIAAIRANRFYVFTHKESRAAVRDRWDRIAEGFDALDGTS